MRTIYSDELKKEFNIIVPYVERLEQDKVVFKRDTPESVKKLYEHYLLETKRIKEKYIS